MGLKLWQVSSGRCRTQHLISKWITMTSKEACIVVWKVLQNQHIWLSWISIALYIDCDFTNVNKEATEYGVVVGFMGY